MPTATTPTAMTELFIAGGGIHSLLTAHQRETTQAIKLFRGDMVLDINNSRRDIKRGLNDISHLLCSYAAESATHNQQLTALLQATHARRDAIEQTIWENAVKTEAILLALVNTSTLVTTLSKQFHSISRASQHSRPSPTARLPANTFHPILAATQQTPLGTLINAKDANEETGAPGSQPVTLPGANHRTQSLLESLTEDRRAQSSLKCLVEAATTNFRAKTYWSSRNMPAPHSSQTTEGAPTKLMPKITQPTPNRPSLACPAPVDTFGTLGSTTGPPPQP
jgi:hypothetical protein